MKRIFLSLSMIGVVGAVAAIGSTGAFFTDAQTAANNIFTAGSVHILVDHSLSTYNGVGGLTVVTDPSWTFTSATSTPSSGSAVDLTFIHPAWETISGANWIWATDGPTDPAGTADQTYTFTKTFNWTGPVSSASLQFGADNYYDVYLNGTLIDSNHQLITDNFQDPHTTDVSADIVQGVNTITFVGENQHVDGSDAASNPAGIILKLVISGQQTFGPTDLNGQTFWNFSDVKPQDTGRDVISLHDPANDAWTCMLIGNIRNNENDLTAPEIADGDNTPGVGGVGGGELGKYLHVFLWHDLNGDGIYNPPTETPITPTPIDFNFTGTTSLPIHDSTTGNGPMLSGSEDDVGAAWCAGTLTVDPGTGAISCDGSSVGNDAQTDSTLADLGFYATQARNQPNFSCSTLDTGGCSVSTTTDLVTDGGFETPVVTNAALWDIFPSPVDGWTVAWRSDIPTTFQTQTRPAIANMELHRGVLGNAFEGAQYTELDSDWGGPSDSGTGEPASVVISQTIATTPGTTYTLHFAFAPRPNTTADENTMQVGWGGTVVNTVPPTAGGSGPIAWQTFDVSVTATTTATTLSFTDLGTADSEGTFLDDVELHASSCVNPTN